MTRGVLGERILLEHGAEVPAHHRAVTTWINWLTLPGAAAMGWGLWMLDPGLTVLGVWMTMLPKLWFLDRMVWLHGEWVAAGRAVPGAAAVTGEGRG